MKAAVAFVVVWCLLISSRPAAAQEPIESRSIVSEQAGLIAASDGARLSLGGWPGAQPHFGSGIPKWKVFVLTAAVIVVAVLVVRATNGNTPYHPPTV